MTAAVMIPDGVTTGGAPSTSLLGRLFGSRVINDAHEMITLEIPHIVDRGRQVPVVVEVNWAMVLAKAVAWLYLIVDGQWEPRARVMLLPDLVPPHLEIPIRLDEPTTVRAVVECGDGTLLQAQRWVWVMPSTGHAEESTTQSQTEDRP